MESPVSLFWSGRMFLRNQFFRFLSKALQTDDAKMALAASMTDLLNAPCLERRNLANFPAPYEGLGTCDESRSNPSKTDTIFITGRFRSGSTLLWNLFRHISGCVAYYEPFNERRWFDPNCRGDRICATHRKVEDYWSEYDGMDFLGSVYDERWTDQRLYMPTHAWDDAMRRYIELLIAHAEGRAVLQFNRIDFRLPWLRATFPNATFLHVYRHPRDQWCSSLMDIDCFPANGRMADFAPNDKFYLRSWAQDLKYQFPFLDERQVQHPYELFYLIWKLSYLFGRRYAHHSLSFEDLVTSPATELPKILDVCRIAFESLGELMELFVTPRFGRWRDYADEQWFREREARCEGILDRFLGDTPLLEDDIAGRVHDGATTPQQNEAQCVPCAIS